MIFNDRVQFDVGIFFLSDAAAAKEALLNALSGFSLNPFKSHDQTIRLGTRLEISNSA